MDDQVHKSILNNALKSSNPHNRRPLGYTSVFSPSLYHSLSQSFIYASTQINQTLAGILQMLSDALPGLIYFHTDEWGSGSTTNLEYSICYNCRHRNKRRIDRNTFLGTHWFSFFFSRNHNSCSGLQSWIISKE